MKSYWNLAITFSLVFHGVLLMQLPKVAFFSKKISLIEKEIKKEITLTHKEVEPKMKVKTDMVVSVEPTPYIENIIDTLIKNSGFAAIGKADVFKRNAKEMILSEVPPHNKILKKNPAYMNYYRLVREKIRAKAHRYYRSGGSGKVLLSFVVLKDGALGELSLDMESANNARLRQITLKSIRSSAPFPPFPDELGKYAQLSFRIPIYFKNN